MKRLVIIWSLMLACIAVFPCGDAVAADNCDEQVHWHDASAHDHHAGEGMDNCSPLCSCHCCHVHVTRSAAEQVSFINPFSEIFSSVIYSRYVSPHTALWHPPQV